MRLGNGRWESTIFNSRLQPTQIALGNVQNAANLLKLNYDYGTNDNNGNVLSQQITVPTVGSSNTGFTAVQNYTYDSLDRIKNATENSVANGQSSSNQTWKQTFNYDRFGNRTFDTANNNTTTLAANCPVNVCNPSANVANNRLIGASYDSSGNTITDAENRTFVYDGENKQTQVSNSSGVVGRYVYDGDGKRVKKISALEVTIFVYDAGGKMIAEYSTATNPTPQVSYLTSDNLGTPRINTDQTGTVISRHDYQPFGEEAVTAQRVNRSDYRGDAVRKQFTSYERDNESDLDFAEARMYNSKHGRFTSTDPYDVNFVRQNVENDREGEEIFTDYIAQPQHWNHYAYTLNNPLRYTDPDGELEYETTLLGQKIKIKISDKISEEEQGIIRKKLDAGIDLINQSADKLTKKEQNIIKKIKGISVVENGEGGIQRSGTDLKTGIFTITKTPDLIFSSDNKTQPEGDWVAGIIIHDSFHVDQHNRKLSFAGKKNGAAREREANAFAAGIGKTIGMSSSNVDYLIGLSKDPGTRYLEPFKKRTTNPNKPRVKRKP